MVCMSFVSRLLLRPDARMWSGVVTALLLHAFVVAWMVAACTAESILSERWTSLENECVGHMLTRASTAATGLRETASAPLCRLPGQYWMLKEYLRHFSFSLKRRGSCIFLRSLSANIPVCGWWSVTTIICRQPMTNIRHFSSARAIAAASPSIGAYRLSASVQNLLPANTMYHPSEQHTGVFFFLAGHVQYFCNNRKPMPSLLQSRARQVTLFMSKVVTPFLTKLTMICLDCWKAFSRLSFQTKCVFLLTRSRNGSIMGRNEYAHATWLTSLNQDLASVIFLEVGKVDIAFNRLSQGVTPEDVIWRPPNWTTSWQNWNFSLLRTIPFFSHNY